MAPELPTRGLCFLGFAGFARHAQAVAGDAVAVVRVILGLGRGFMVLHYDFA